MTYDNEIHDYITYDDEIHIDYNAKRNNLIRREESFREF